MIHLMLAALGAVAVEAQSLVGHELLGARVDRGANGNTAGTKSVQRKSKRVTTGEGRRRERKLVQMCRGIGRASGVSQKHTQGRDLDVKEPLDIMIIIIPCRKI